LHIFEAKLDVDPVSHFRSLKMWQSRRRNTNCWRTDFVQNVFESQFFLKLIRAVIKKVFKKIGIFI